MRDGEVDVCVVYSACEEKWLYQYINECWLKCFGKFVCSSRITDILWCVIIPGNIFIFLIQRFPSNIHFVFHNRYDIKRNEKNRFFYEPLHRLV